MSAEQKQVRSPGQAAQIPSLSQVVRLENIMAVHPSRCPVPGVRHFHAQGIYGRAMLIPKDMTISGKTHAKEHLFVIIYGDLSVMTENGVVRAGAGDVVEGKAGTKRVAYAHEDTYCITFSENPSNTRDLAQLELEIIMPDPQEVIDFASNPASLFYEVKS